MSDSAPMNRLLVSYLAYSVSLPKFNGHTTVRIQPPSRHESIERACLGRLGWPGRGLIVLLACLAGCQSGPPGTALQTTGSQTAVFQPMSLQLDPTLANPSSHPLLAPLTPSNDRNWKTVQARLARAEFKGDHVTVRDIRNFRHLADDQHEIDYYDKKFDLDAIRSVDFVVVPFAGAPNMAHTMLSFGFEGGEHVVLSVEARYEQDETYNPVLGLMNQYELIYVLGDERDLIQLRTNVWLNDVYIYPAKATPPQVRELFVDVLRRANQLAERPEFYNTLTNNCTTNIVDHINRLVPNRVPLDQRILLNGQSDRLAYELGLLDADRSFEETKAAARINYLAYLYRDSADFSTLIRR